MVIFNKALVDRIIHPACEGHENGGFFADPNDCTKFRECSNGKLYQFECPSCNPYLTETCLDGKLVFDENTATCVDANLAEC